MPRVRPMLAISIGFTIASAAMFTVAASMAFRSALFISLDRDGATAAVVIAAMCWLELRRDAHREGRDGGRRPLHDECRRREAVLALTINSLADERDQPFRQLHSA
jgi:hypothetical protein